MWNERERKNSGRAARAAVSEKKKRGTTKILAPRAMSKGKEIEVISLENELKKFHLSGDDGYESAEEEGVNAKRLELGKEEDSFVTKYR